MKKLSNLLLVLFVAILTFSCENGTEEPTTLENDFSITFRHSGNSERFIFTVATITEGGSGWRHSNGDDTNPGFNDLGLTTQYLITNNPTVVETKSSIRSFTLQYNVIFVPTNQTPASITGTFEIRKNGEVIDTQEFTVTDTQQGTASFTKEYK